MSNILCPCCSEVPDTQLHFISCSKLSVSVTEAEYNCIFGANEEKMETVIRKLEQRYQERKNFID